MGLADKCNGTQLPDLTDEHCDAELKRDLISSLLQADNCPGALCVFYSMGNDESILKVETDKTFAGNPKNVPHIIKCMSWLRKKSQEVKVIG